MKSRDNQPINLSDRRKQNKSIFARDLHITPTHVGIILVLFVLIYLGINLYIYATKEQVSIYEVQSLTNNHAEEFDGICIRNEQLVYSGSTGYINYYIQDQRRAAKNAVVYSLDSSEGNIYGTLNSEYENYVLKDSEISEIKSLLSGGHNLECMNMSDYSGLNDVIADKLFDFVSANKLEAMTGYVESKGSGSDFKVIRTPKSGIISYYCDAMTGYTVDDIGFRTFSGQCQTNSLKSTGLVGSSDAVYRICSDEQWQIVALVKEDFYMDHLETRNIDVQIDNSPYYLKAELSLKSERYIPEIGEPTPKPGEEMKYFAILTFSDNMLSYINSRYVKVKFSSEDEKGLKVPVSAITQKGYYLIPLSVFDVEEGYSGYVLKREVYDSQTGSVSYESIYPSKYYSDGYYAYIDMSLLKEGDYLVNPLTQERVKVGTVSYLDGVYSVNRGYYVFVRIEKIKSNQEYSIVKDNTPNGLRLYDHIALKASDAIEGNIIY